MDFGIAKSLFGGIETTKLTSTRCVLGTPYYIAPEQILNRDIGPHTDQYALALIVAEMLSGKIVRANKSAEEIIYKEIRKPIRKETLKSNKRIPQPVIQALEIATDPDPKKRFPDINSFVDSVLTSFKDQGVKTTTIMTTSGRLPPEHLISLEEEVLLEARKKRRWILAISFVLLLLILAVIYFFLKPF